MTPENFCYWLQGRAELKPNETPTEEEWKIIKDHLNLVFDKQTPTYTPSDYSITTPFVDMSTVTCADGNAKPFC